MQAVVSGQGRDGGPVAGALTLGLVARMGGRPDPGRGQGLTPFLRERLIGRPGATSAKPGKADCHGPKRATTTVPRAMHTWVAWVAQ